MDMQRVYLFWKTFLQATTKHEWVFPKYMFLAPNESQANRGDYKGRGNSKFEVPPECEGVATELSAASLLANNQVSSRT